MEDNVTQLWQHASDRLEHKIDLARSETACAFDVVNQNFININIRFDAIECCLDAHEEKLNKLEKGMDELKQSNNRIELLLQQLVPRQ